MRETILKKLANWHASHPWRMLIVVGLLTVGLVVCMLQLTVTMRTSDLLPEGDPRVVEFNRIVDEFVTATNLVVVVQGEEARIKEFADELKPKILQLRDSSQNEDFQERIEKLENKIEKLRAKKNSEGKIAELQTKVDELQARIDMQLFQRVDYKAEIDFLRDHMLMLVKEEDLRNIKDVFMDPNLTVLLTNINNSMEKEYVGQQESISTREKEDGAVGFLDGIESLVLRLQEAVRGKEMSAVEIRETADELLFGDPYMLSYDKRALVMIAIPNFTLMDRDLIGVAAEAVQAVVTDQLEHYPDVEAGLTGPIAREHDEQTHSSEAIGFTSGIALIVILILLILSFRMVMAPVLAVVTLVFGVVWAMGASWIVVGQLNMFTSMMSVVLLGLGIDFAIHFISSFSEWRAAGDSIAIALEKTFLKSGKGIITGALTTACAFLTLMISQARGMREMGLVTGIGLLSILLATLLFLPVMLVLKERLVGFLRGRMLKKGRVAQRDISFRFLGRTGELLSRHYVFTIVAAGVVTVLLVWSAVTITWDENYMSADPKSWTSTALVDTVSKKFDLSMDSALILANDVKESREISEKCRELPSVAITSDISRYLPSPEEQQERVPHIVEVRERMRSSTIQPLVGLGELATLTTEVDRLEMNVIEMQDMAYLGGRDKVDDKCKEIVGDPDRPGSRNIIQELHQILEGDESQAIKGLSRFQQEFAPYFKESVVRMCSIEPIHLDELPESILDSYSNKTRDQFLVTVYPAGDLWLKETLHRFVGDLDRVSERATGMPPLGVSLIRIFGRDGRNAILLTLVIVFLLLWVDFKSPRYALTAMIPLALGVFWMVGFMNLTGQKLGLMNVMGLPMIIGIGIDDGVHIMHRWIQEGKGKIRLIFSSTGKAILLTSLTTMFAFGSLAFSAFPGWIQFGTALALGVGTCFLTTVIILPGILGMIERRNSK